MYIRIMLVLLPLSIAFLASISASDAWKSGKSCSSVEDTSPQGGEETFYPSSGIFTASLSDPDSLNVENALIQTFSSLMRVVDCAELTFTNVTSDTVLRRMQRQSSAMSGGRLIWKDKKEYMFFLPDDKGVGGSGTWLLGEKLGVDSGMVYAKPTEAGVLVPVSPSGAAPLDWYILHGSTWTVDRSLQVHCSRQQELGRVYTASIYVAPMSDTEDGLLLAETSPSVLARYRPDVKEDTVALYIHGNAHETRRTAWGRLSSPALASCALGSPVNLTTAKGAPSCTGLPVNAEWLYDGYRITYRCLDRSLDTEKYAHIQPHKGFLRGAGLATVGAGGNALWAKDLVVPSPTDAETRQAGVLGAHDALAKAVPGDFLWLWVRAQDESSGHGRVETEELLVECVTGSGPNSVAPMRFRFHEADRRVVMRRGVLSRAIDTLVYSPATRRLAVGRGAGASMGIGESQSQPRAGFGKALVPLGAAVLGQDMVAYLRNYLLRVDRRFGELPACFMYHAAVGMPKSLVYAAELVCVLMGHKSVTMVQYETSSEFQWKFPLVQSLVDASVAAAQTAEFSDAPRDVDIGFTELTYRDVDRTLVIYRKQYAHLVSQLRPRGQAQALHIAPYVEADPRPRLEVVAEQVYSSWWNGFLLGYPLRFVESYLKNLPPPNSLDSAQIDAEARRAETDAMAWLDATGAVAPPPIGAGVAPDITSEVLLFMRV